jgi:hypothetical protein
MKPIPGIYPHCTLEIIVEGPVSYQRRFKEVKVYFKAT